MKEEAFLTALGAIKTNLWQGQSPTLKYFILLLPSVRCIGLTQLNYDFYKSFQKPLGNCLK